MERRKGNMLRVRSTNRRNKGDVGRAPCTTSRRRNKRKVKSKDSARQMCKAKDLKRSNLSSKATPRSREALWLKALQKPDARKQEKQVETQDRRVSRSPIGVMAMVPIVFWSKFFRTLMQQSQTTPYTYFKRF